MAKQSGIEQDGVIVEALSNAMFRVELENGHETVSYTHLHHAQLSSSIAKAVLEEVKGRADLL